MLVSRNSLLSSAALALVCAAVAAPAHAQDADAPATSNDDEIIVWGTRIIADNLALGEDDIAIKQADHLSDLLRPIPGVDVGGTHSVNTRINFRGLDDRDLNVFIDGALQTNYLYHHIGNLLINPDILQSADIQLGTNSVTHGGLGGAIRFETKDAVDLLLDGRSIGGRLSGSWNSNDLWSGSATVYGQVGGLDLLAYYSRADRGNFEDGSGRQTIGSDGVTQDVLVKASMEIDDRQSVRLSYDRYWDEGDYTQRPDMGVLTNAAITGDILLPTEYRRESINAGYDLDLGDALELALTVYTNDMRLYRDESNPGIPRGILTDRQVTSDNWGVNLMARSIIDSGDVRQALTYGAEYFDQSFDYISDVTGGAPSETQSGETFAIFLEDEIELIDGAVIVRPGVRYNHAALDYQATGESGSWDKLTWGLASEVEVTEGLRVLGSYTTLFRGPELAEPFGGNAGVKLVNPDLEPETGNNLELGARYEGDLGAVRVGLTGKYFRTRINNYVGEVPAPTAGAVWDANLGTAQIDGFEVGANAHIGSFDVFAGFSSAVLDASQLTNPDTAESLREIGDTLSGEIAWSSSDRAITLGLNAQHVFEKPTISGTPKDSYTVVNISARWEDAAGVEGLSLIAGVDNLFDETYTSHASRSGATFHPVFGALILNDVEPGRNVKLTAAMRF